MNIFITVLLSIVTTIGVYNYVPLEYIEFFDFRNREPNLGVSITTINSTDRISDSRTTINDNFSSLNAGKIENSTTSVAAITTLSNLVSVGTITTGTWNASTLTVARGGTGATSLTADSLLVGNGTSAITGTTSPTIGYFYANSTTATSSIFGHLQVSKNLHAATGTFGVILATSTTATSTFSGDLLVSKNLSSSNFAKGGLKTLTDGATITINWDDGNTQYVILGDNRTIAFTNIKTAATMRLFLCQDSTGSRTLTWPSSNPVMRWASGSVPTLTTTANKCDIIGLLTASSTHTIFGSASVNY